MPSSIDNLKTRVLALLRSAKEQENSPDFAWRIMAGFFFAMFLGVLVAAFISYRWATSNELATPIPKGERSPITGAEIAEAASIYEKRAAEHEILKRNPTRAPNLSRSGIAAPALTPEPTAFPPADAPVVAPTAP
ncbi:MAG TPA: hypothetical protein VLB83_02580 [Candidatus Paceibacterota bacterium]|nr:hypothetical protein [Candidatus Paceibacterota bacterium]